ncbi:MAG TPA: Spy/CpxP family protein refolding chaperone [Acidobacteriota bacterium]|jgi:Spy/CpxP family protein refolding chaperone
MKSRRLARFLFLLAALCGAAPLYAQIDIPQGKWWKNDAELVQALNLTPHQVEQIENIFESYRDTLLDLQLDFQKKSLDLKRMLQADRLDEQRIEVQATQLEQARSELAKQRLMMMVKIRKQLTPDQWRILQEKHAQRKKERELMGIPKNGGRPGQLRIPPGGK